MFLILKLTAGLAGAGLLYVAAQWWWPIRYVAAGYAPLAVGVAFGLDAPPPHALEGGERVADTPRKEEQAIGEARVEQVTHRSRVDLGER